MIAAVRKKVGCLLLKHNSSFCRSDASLSLILHNFSTSPEREAVDTAAVCKMLVKKHHFSPDIASSVATGLNRCRSPEKADSILSFLKENCFSSSQLEKIAKGDVRKLTASNEDDIMLKINIFKDFGFSPEDIAKVITYNQVILQSSAEKKIIPQLSTLKGFLGSNREVVELVKREGWYMTVDLEKSFVPNLEFLKSSGVTMGGINMLLCNFPRCLLVKPDIMRKSVKKAKEIGADQSSKTFAYAVRVIASLKDETWELKLQCFRDLGISESEVLAMFRKMPMVLCTSLEKIKEIERILVGTGRFKLCDLINDPRTLMCSVEKRYKPRLQILEMLESKKLIEKWPGLPIICRWPQISFLRNLLDHMLIILEMCVLNLKDWLNSKERKSNKLSDYAFVLQNVLSLEC